MSANRNQNPTMGFDYHSIASTRHRINYKTSRQSELDGDLPPRTETHHIGTPNAMQLATPTAPSLPMRIGFHPSLVRFSICMLIVVALGAPAIAEQPIRSARSNDDVETTKLPIKTVRVFEDLEIDRPIIVTHANDGSGRLFIASQFGVVYVLPNGSEDDEPEVFMDMEEKVTYKDRQNEEGFLGFAFHPEFKTNGQFFIFYSTVETPHLSVISRFTTKADDPTVGDVDSEEVLMTIPQKYWNHNGGTITFGPDGYLYIGLGDGGAANDPDGNGQNLATLNGSILRIDVDSKTGDLPYGIPEDNPFVDREGARPEIYAYGLRNVWRMSFDPKTNAFWVADVGQNIWEEINIVTKGGNYGWNVREANHEFVPNEKTQKEDEAAKPEGMIDPIWEYHHDIGKSITGGVVYRGKQLPELDGVYLFADYVSGKIWGLRYDLEAEKVTAHYEFDGVSQVPVITFGENEAGDVFFTDPVGRVFTFVAE